MKKVLVYFIFSLFVVMLSGFLLAPQDRDFDKQWEQVEKFEKEGLPKSAINIVDEIYTQAKAEGNEPQVLKSLIYRVSLQSRFEEDHLIGAIEQFENELKTAKTPENQILHSLLGELYQWYFNNNRWQILDRGVTMDYENKDIKTWDSQKLSQVINSHYMASLLDQTALEKIKLSSFSAILHNSKKPSLKLWPSLYDLLANRALNYLGSANTFDSDFFGSSLNNMDLFSNAGDFVKLDLKLDTTSKQFITLTLYQRLLAFHIGQDNSEALLDLDLRRLDYINNNSQQSEQTQSAYIQALENLSEKFSSNELFVKVSALLARQYVIRGGMYNPFEGEKYRNELNIAEQICVATIEKFPNSKDISLCKNILKEINETSYSLQINAAEIPGKPFLALLTFRNTSELFFKAVKVESQETIDDFVNNNNDKTESYLKREASYNWSQKLPETEDHQSHSTEISLPAMESGQYMIFASQQEQFNDKSKVVYQPVWITNLSYLSKNNTTTGNLDLFVIDRTTGQAIESAELTTYNLVYNQNSREREIKKLNNYFSNEDGFISIEISEDGKQNRLFFKLQNENDFLTSHGQSSLYKSKAGTKVRTKTYFFTDRAIYRPGQTVYFKGIVVDKSSDAVILKPNFNVEVKYYDANRKNTQTQDLKTNEFGSFQGAFVIPTGGLNGEMMIKNKSGSIGFAVEEYKRPTFEVVFDTVREKFKLGDEITVNGKAENFAGSKLQNAEVSYRVVQAPIIVPYFREYRPYPVATEINIANGTVITDENGIFLIQFPTHKVEDTENKELPQQFTIYANVTDITGEVQSSMTNVIIGKNALLLSITSDEKIQKEQNEGIQFSAKNLSGAPVSADVDVKVFQLTPPDQVFVERYWSRPDLFVIQEDSFRENFPNAVYKNESEKEQWEKQEVYSAKASLNGKATLLKDFLTDAAQGEYLVEALSVSDANDTTITKQYFTLYSAKSKKLPGKMLSWSLVTKDKAEPGEIVQLIIGSAEKKSRVYYEIINGDELIESNWITASRSQKVIDIPVLEAYRGDFEIRTSLVRLNRAFIESHRIEVPFTNKKLDITLETHRDFLTPGKKEEWQVKISGPGGEKLAAELLAGMYDASLDQFKSNSWDLDLYSTKHTRDYWNTGYFRSSFSDRLVYQHLDFESASVTVYPEINWFDYRNYGRGDIMLREMTTAGSPRVDQDSEDLKIKDSNNYELEELAMDEVTPTPVTEQKDDVIPVRTNFNETAFFYPQLKTDSSGNVVFSFTTPDALTEWKLMMLATSKDLKTGQIVEQFKAHKDLMIIPNLPRFVREGDKFSFSAKVVNFTENPIRGSAEIEFYDALTMKTINIFSDEKADAKTLNIGAGKSQLVDWKISIPAGLSLIGYRIKAVSGDFTDGEERLIPVLTNRMLVTETLPLPVKGNQTQTFTFQKLVNSEKTMQISTRENYKLTLEFTSNPAWYAVQALPYLEAPQTESAGNLFRQYFANALSSYILDSNPKIKNVIEAWKQLTPNAFYSNLQKNEELKKIVLNATPWVLEAEDETEQKRRIAILFDVNRMANQQMNALTKLKQNQMPSGAWPWFKGMKEDRHTTQNIVLGIAKLHDKGVINLKDEDKIRRMTKKAVAYLDREMEKEFEKLKKNDSKYKTTNHLGSNQIEYLYARSILLEDVPIPAGTKEAFTYYSAQAKKYWLKKDNYLQGMIALTLYRLGNRNEAEGIMRSLKERALHSDEMGMYWRIDRGWHWYQAPVETQAMVIEAYAQILNDPKSVEQMKVWLLKQKQTTRWNTSSATAEAVYALLLTGDNLLEDDQLVKIKMGGEQINPREVEGMKIEPGTGYFKTFFTGKEIQPKMGKIEVENPNKGIAWGAAYWQYFEDLDKITGHDSPLSVEKVIFVEELTEEGPVIKPMEMGQNLKTGDRVVMRLVIKTDRVMDYVHLTDMRATALEPVNAISGYNYSGGLGFYKSVTDVSTEFFIRRLPKGTFVIEYTMAVTQKGDFSNGISSIQSYYAPEFAAHSEGTRIVVK